MPRLDGRQADAVARCADRLQAGELVAFPTETVYGLGADACQDEAVRRIFERKGRPSDHPLIVHIDDANHGAAGLAAFAASVPDFSQRLVDTFWPGPLTLILPRREGVATAAAGGQASIGLRCPAHPVAQALLQACRARGVLGLAGPSANRFGRISPTRADHVCSEFGEDLTVLDGGPCTVGIESTIVDCTRAQPVLLRPGAIRPDRLEAACGRQVLTPEQADRAQVGGIAPRAAGTLEAHYAPLARLRLMDAAALQAALDVFAQTDAGSRPVIAVYARSPLRVRGPALLQRRMPDDADAAAQELYDSLRGFDARGVKLIWVETPPDAPQWDAVRDRLQRAAAS